MCNREIDGNGYCNGSDDAGRNKGHDCEGGDRNGRDHERQRTNMTLCSQGVNSYSLSQVSYPHHKYCELCASATVRTWK